MRMSNSHIPFLDSHIYLNVNIEKYFGCTCGYKTSPWGVWINKRLTRAWSYKQHHFAPKTKCRKSTIKQRYKMTKQLLLSYSTRWQITLSNTLFGSPFNPFFWIDSMLSQTQTNDFDYFWIDKLLFISWLLYDKSQKTFVLWILF